MAILYGLIGVSIIWLGIWLVMAPIRKEAREEEAEIDRKKAAWKATRQRAEADRDAFFESQELFTEQASGRSPGRMLAKLLLGKAAARLVEYHLDGGFTIVNDQSVSSGEMLSVAITNPLVSDAWYRTEYVPKQKQRSVIGRAAVGGVLLGPVGAVVGAISGLDGASRGVEERLTLQARMVPGPPHLVITTTSHICPVLEIELDDHDATVRWLARLQTFARS